MVLDEELDELHVFGRKAVLAEKRGPRPAQLRVIAPRPLAMSWNIAGDVRKPVALEAGDEAAAQRILVRELEHREARTLRRTVRMCCVHGVHVGKDRAASGRRCAGSG